MRSNLINGDLVTLRNRHKTVPTPADLIFKRSKSFKPLEEGQQSFLSPFPQHMVVGRKCSFLALGTSHRPIASVGRVEAKDIFPGGCEGNTLGPVILHQ